MNDQMYKQNRRVMSNEYGQSLINQKADKNHKTSVIKRGRISSGSSDFVEHQSASSGVSENETFLKRFYRNVIQFIFSQVLPDLPQFNSKHLFLGWCRLSHCWLHNPWSIHVSRHRDLRRLWP